MTVERLYLYPDGTRQRLGGSLDHVPVANATERTAPRRVIQVDRALLVGLLDAWQGYVEDVGPDNADECLAEIIGDIAEVLA